MRFLVIEAAFFNFLAVFFNLGTILFMAAMSGIPGTIGTTSLSTIGLFPFVPTIKSKKEQ